MTSGHDDSIPTPSAQTPAPLPAEGTSYGPHPYAYWVPAPAPGPASTRHRVRHSVAAAVSAVSLAAGIAVGVTLHSRTSRSTSLTNASSGGDSTLAAVESKVDPFIVDVYSTLGYEDGESAGTGVVLTSKGEILTNNHVINGATSLKVVDLGNGRTYAANVVGYDVTADLAVLQLVGASNLKTATFSSSPAAVGQAVIALGNAGGVGGTPSVATGTVTDLGQSITASEESGSGSEQLTGLIETNAALQAGDSGGPLVTTKGQVLGIDTAASASSASGYSNAATTSQSYAIPASTALHVARQIAAGSASTTVHIGTTSFLGVEVESAFSGSGLTVAGVTSGGPADTAGIVAGDTITAVDGDAISSATALSSAIQAHAVGSTLTVSYTDASGAAHTATVTLVAGPAA